MPGSLIRNPAIEGLRKWMAQGPSVMDDPWEAPVKRALSLAGIDDPTEQIAGMAAPLAITSKGIGKRALKLMLEDERGTGFLNLNRVGFPGYLWPTMVQASPRGKGIATDLYREALDLAEREGLGGIASTPEGRTELGDAFWRNLADRLGAEQEKQVIDRMPVEILRKKR